MPYLLVGFRLMSKAFFVRSIVPDLPSNALKIRGWTISKPTISSVLYGQAISLNDFG
nr:MAG TPA: hypothetical protein [Crassvirales sp.]